MHPFSFNLCDHACQYTAAELIWGFCGSMGTSQSWMVAKPSIGQGTDFCFRKTWFSAFVHVCSCWSCSYHCFGLVHYLGFLSRGYAFNFSCIYWIFNCSLPHQVYRILFLIIFHSFINFALTFCLHYLFLCVWIFSLTSFCR